MDRLICPSCGTSTSFNPVWCTVRGILEEQRREDSITYGQVSVQLIEPHEYGVANYAILECQACSKRLVVENGEYAGKGEWQVVYPIQHKPVAEEISEPAKSEFEEANLCFAVTAYRACVSMCQITLEALWHEQQVSGLDQLKDKISATLYNGANEIRLWGNLAKHELITDPVSKEDAEQLLGYLEILLNEVYIEPKRLDDLAEKRKELEEKG